MAVNASVFQKAISILEKHNFLCEVTPHGNLQAQPQDIPITGELITKVQDAGFFCTDTRSVTDGTPMLVVLKP